VVVDPTNHSVLYVLGRDGVYKSDDDGASWRLVRPGAGGIGSVLTISPPDP
jgi:hypothetical protein